MATELETSLNAFKQSHIALNGAIVVITDKVKKMSDQQFYGVVGEAGEQGFGVSICPVPTWLDELGLTQMVGTGDKASANYGNYQHSNGGISVFIPKFYYKIGDTSDPAYSIYGTNTITIKGIDTFSDEAMANAAGFALHRAFVDGNVAKAGFFIDKYLASKDSTISCKSVKNGIPISLTTVTSFTNSTGMTGCTGIIADSVVLSRARGLGWNVPTIFQYDALAKLSLAHAQHASNATNCAWYDPNRTTNFPKGCNNGSLADINDPSVTFVSAGNSGDAGKPRTGSASDLAKTTHNGQLCGVTDINGAMMQVTIGLTVAGIDAADASQKTAGTAYILKRASYHKNLTGGFGGYHDAWGTTTSLATNFDVITNFEPWGSTTGMAFLGNGAARVFNASISGTDYLRSCSGIAPVAAMSTTGTNQFGNDGVYQYVLANQAPLVCGNWSAGSWNGIFYRQWGVHRSQSFQTFGFRSAAYGS
jgi:hypothetical protein